MISIQEAPDEATPSNANADDTIESNHEKSIDGTPTIEQCDVSALRIINFFFFFSRISIFY